MPRSKPDNIQVHRIELGGWERERIKQAELVAAGAVLIPAAGIVAVGVGTGLAGYALYQWLKDGPFKTISDTAKEVVDEYEEIYNNPTTQAIRQGVDSQARSNPMIRFWRIFIPFV